jgi:hypothetical protein
MALVARHMRPAMFAKLEPMKEKWGPRTGVAIHIVGYTIMPIVFGAFAVMTGLAGGSLF